MNQRSLASLASDRKAFDETVSNKDTLRHLGPAVKQLTPPNFQGSLMEGKVNGGTNAGTPTQLKRNLGSHQNKVWDAWLDLNAFARKLIYLTSLGCIIYVSFRLINTQFWRMGNAYRWRLDKPSTSVSTSWTTGSPVYQTMQPASIKGNRILRNMKKLLGMLDIQIRRQSETVAVQKSCLDAGLSSSANETYRLPMPVEEAETLVKKWQEIKAEALGPNHYVHRLFDVLDESMLDQVSCT